tara:strand:+ start:536 stop:730 length:195 start_codon:yes stop_codon:yes gene_type:complete
VKVGDLVRLPDDSHYWWGGKTGIVVGIEDKHQLPHYWTLRVMVGCHYTKFGANFVKLISESRET